MIRHTKTDDGRPWNEHESAVVELLMRLYEPTFVEDWAEAWTEESVVLEEITDEDQRHHVARQIEDLIQRRRHDLTEAEIAILRRCSDVEMNHAAWIEQARSFGLHLQLWPNRLTADTEYRIRWRKASWPKRSGTHAQVHTDYERAKAHVRRLQAEGDLDVLSVDERPVGQWRALDQLVAWANSEGV